MATWLNLGSGGDYREEFTNVDIRSDDVKVDVEADITDLPYEDESVRRIVARDVLEHFPEPVDVLEEWFRVLEPNGFLIVRVPDWRVLGDKQYWNNKDLRQVEKHVYGGHKNPYDVHHTLWTGGLMEERMRDAGFNYVLTEHLRERPLHWHLAAVAGKNHAHGSEMEYVKRALE